MKLAGYRTDVYDQTVKRSVYQKYMYLTLRWSKCSFINVPILFPCTYNDMYTCNLKARIKIILLENKLHADISDMYNAC